MPQTYTIFQDVRMEAALYLIPVTLGDTPVEQVTPVYNHDIIVQIKYFIVENIRSACRFLAKTDKNINIGDLIFYELNEHTDLKSIGNYLDPIVNDGSPMGVISEAGCPAIADPGADIVALAQKKKIKVIPLTGPSSIVMALMGSGFNGQNFAFSGYLPVKPGDRTNKLKQLESRMYKEDQTQIFIETPYRNGKMIETVLSACRPDTKLCIAAGITCPEEYIRTLTIAQWKKEKIPELGKIPAIFLLYK